MTKHRDLLPRVVADLSTQHPEAAIFLGGSVQRHEERPNSDLDLFVVFQGAGPIQLDQQSRREGIAMDIAYLPCETFRREWRRKPFLFWMFAWSELLTDPAGIGRKCQKPARNCFLEHPGVNALWKRQVEEVRRHKQDRSYVLEFPTWTGFAGHLEKTVAAGEV